MMTECIRQISRKEFLKQFSMASALLFAACTPAKILLKAYPEEFKNDPRLRERVLRAFVTTVIPGADEDDPHLVRIFEDEYYPFHSYCAFFTSDLCNRSSDLFSEERFDRLTSAQQTKVIADGLEADATASRLYRGAILMAQVSFYAGIYNSEKGCPLIDFHGANTGFTTDEMYYPNSGSMLAPALTTNGIYN